MVIKNSVNPGKGGLFISRYKTMTYNGRFI